MKYLAYITCWVLILASCEDPIDVVLDDAESQIVVDAWLDNISEIQTIRISQSLPYFTNEFTPGIVNAEVMVENNNGEQYIFNHQDNGNYILTLNPGERIGSVGDSFRLSVIIDNDIFLAQTTMNRVPVIDSLTQEFREDEVFTDDGIYCQVFARDFNGLGDTYWIKTYKNGAFLNRAWEINIAYDAGFDSGGEVDGLVFIYPIRDLVNETDDDAVPLPYVAGDEIRVEIHSISNEAFAFMEIMRDQLLNSNNGIFAEPLANTRGNIMHENGDKTVLGVFNVAAMSSSELIVQ